MHELIPNEAVMALLVNPTTPAAETIVRAVQAAARDHGLKLHVLHATTIAILMRSLRPWLDCGPARS